MADPARVSSAGARPLSELLAEAEPLSIDERHELVRAAQVLIDQLYVHLPLKRAMHAVDPAQRLRLLDRRLAGFSERRFHDELLSIFTTLRDLHTNYVLPQPFAGMTAVLPFRIETYWEGNAQRYVVTAVSAETDVPPFAVGVEVTHLNGVPIERAVALNGERNAGSNIDARLARGLASLTQRPIDRLAAPDEAWVDVTFVAGGASHEQRFAWQVMTPPPLLTGDAPSQLTDPLAGAHGIDALVEDIRRVQKLLFAPEAMAVERRMADDPTGPDLQTVSTLPHALEFRTLAAPQGDVGYLRIRTFRPGAPLAAWVEEVMRILALLPQEGLIIDVRGNGGGAIPAGEWLLQLLTPRRIEPERLHFISTPLTLKFTSLPGSFLAPWSRSIAESVETGATFSAGLPITPEYPDLCNRVGQVYHGPVVLITDALCYSTTDIFAAGFQDHEIGPVIGTSANTGAGGANVWEYAELLEAMPDELRPLPRGASLRVAMRRCVRVGRRAGDLLEDLGVVSDRIHKLTRRDVLEGNVDLLATAAQALTERPLRAFSAQGTAVDGGIDLLLRTTGLDRLDVHVDGRPRHTLDVTDGERTVHVALATPGRHAIELRGYAAGELVARRALSSTA